MCGPCVDTTGGDPSGGGSGVLTIPIDVLTTDGTVEVFDIANLAVIGAAAGVMIELSAIRQDAGDEGEMGATLLLWGQGARNAAGVGAATPVFSAPGFTDPVLVPWTTVGAFPAGWGATLQFTGNIFQFAFNGVLGQDISWRGAMRIYLSRLAVAP